MGVSQEVVYIGTIRLSRERFLKKFDGGWPAFFLKRGFAFYDFGVVWIWVIEIAKVSVSAWEKNKCEDNRANE